MKPFGLFFTNIDFCLLFFFHFFNVARETLIWVSCGPRVNLSLRPLVQGYVKTILKFYRSDGQKKDKNHWFSDYKNTYMCYKCTNVKLRNFIRSLYLWKNLPLEYFALFYLVKFLKHIQNYLKIQLQAFLNLHYWNWFNRLFF